MNTLKKVTFGVLVAGIAFGVSAFTTLKPKSNIFNYYKTNLNYPDPKDPRGYFYYSSDRCEAGGKICCAHWDIGLNIAPTYDGQALAPTGVTYQLGSNVVGHFE